MTTMFLAPTSGERVTDHAATPGSGVSGRREIDPQGEIRTTDELHPGVLGIMAGCFVIMMIAFWLTFKGSTEALFSVIVSAVYLAMYLGTPWAMLRMKKARDAQDRLEARSNHDGTPESFGEFLAGRMETATGTLTGWEAVAQACSIPVALMLVTIGICIVIATS